MFETVFGSEMPLAARFFIAFLVVLALIGLTAWLVRRFGANRLGGGNTRGRQPRLAVIDAASVDGRRRLVLIRRDNVEHLLMIGGPTDVVVEQNIVRAAAATAREPARVDAPRAEPALRAPPPVENAWPLQPANEPAPPPASRPYRASPTEEPWLAPEPGARPRPADTSSLTGLAAELSTRLAPPETVAPPVRSEPPARASAPPPPPPPVMTAEPEPAQQTDHNLADMAQQLEAALRRTPPVESRPPVTDPLAAQVQPQVQPYAQAHIPAPAPAAEAPPPRAPARDYKLRVDPKFDARPEPRFDSRPEPRFEPPPEPKPQPAAIAGKTVYDSLEEEMANLLGRPPGKT